MQNKKTTLHWLIFYFEFKVQNHFALTSFLIWMQSKNHSALTNFMDFYFEFKIKGQSHHKELPLWPSECYNKRDRETHSHTDADKHMQAAS